MVRQGMLLLLLLQLISAIAGPQAVYAQEEICPKPYTVKPGDTFYKIAAKCSIPNEI